MLLQLLIRELRAIWKHALIGLGLALAVLWYSATTTRNIGSLEAGEGARPVVWFFAYLFIFVINQQIFGREWSGKGKRLQARLPLTAPRLFAVKLLAALSIGVIATILIIRSNDLLLELQPTKYPLAPIDPQIDLKVLAAGWVFVFGTAILGGVIMPQGSLALVFGATVCGTAPLVIDFLERHWFQFHDLPVGSVWPIASGLAMGVGICLGLAGMLVFIWGRLHRHRFVRPTTIALGVIILGALPAIVVGDGELRKVDLFALNDADLRINYFDVHPEDRDCVVLRLDRQDRPFLHSVVLDLGASDPVTAFIPRSEVAGYLPVERELAFDDFDGLRMTLRDGKYHESLGSGTKFRLGSQGGKRLAVAEDACILPVYSRFTRRPGHLIRRVTGVFRGWGVFDETGTTLLNRYPGKRGVLWRDYWLIPDQWTEGRMVRSGLLLQPILGGEPERLAMTDLAIVPGLDQLARVMALGDGNELFYVATDRRRVLALDLATKTTRVAVELPADWAELMTIDRLGDGRWLRIETAAIGGKGSVVAILEGGVGALRLWDRDQLGDLSFWGISRRVMSRNEQLCFGRFEESPAILSLPEGKLVARLPGAHWGEWLDDHRFVYVGKRERWLKLFDATTGKSTLVFSVDR